MSSALSNPGIEINRGFVVFSGIPSVLCFGQWTAQLRFSRSQSGDILQHPPVAIPAINTPPYHQQSTFKISVNEGSRPLNRGDRHIIEESLHCVVSSQLRSFPGIEPCIYWDRLDTTVASAWDIP
ncbi:hypothetical protein V6Z88_001156 [Aspergillus fumigatus]|jgi:hypothetical protein